MKKRKIVLLAGAAVVLAGTLAASFILTGGRHRGENKTQPGITQREEEIGHEDNRNGRMAYEPGRRRKWKGFFKKEDTTADEFIRLYIENSDYSHEQQDYLIKCLEQGDSLDIIREFASPSLSVTNMDWLRRITYRRRR